MSAKKIILTGIKPTGTPHLGNYLGAMAPALELAKLEENLSFFFIADYHALTLIQDKKIISNLIYEVAASWLACGLDPEKIFFYKQSDIPEILELHWILTCLTPKGLMNRAHAYKAVTSENEKNGRDIDDGVNMGLFCYPILMAADILAFNTDLVPVGKDQLQHVEIARDIAEYFNHKYKKTFKLPQSFIQENSSIIPGLDGRKMSKSYGNTIPLFTSSDNLKKLIDRIKTDSSGANDPKDPDQSNIFKIYCSFCSQEQADKFREAFLQGIGWGEAKKELLNLLNDFLQVPREKYNYYINHKEIIDEILIEGGKKVRPIATKILDKVKQTIGHTKN